MSGYNITSCTIKKYIKIKSKVFSRTLPYISQRNVDKHFCFIGSKSNQELFKSSPLIMVYSAPKYCQIENWFDRDWIKTWHSTLSRHAACFIYKKNYRCTWVWIIFYNIWIWIIYCCVLCANNEKIRNDKKDGIMKLDW